MVVGFAPQAGLRLTRFSGPGHYHSANYPSIKLVRVGRIALPSSPFRIPMHRDASGLLTIHPEVGNWSPRQDLHLRSPGPKPGMLLLHYAVFALRMLRSSAGS